VSATPGPRDAGSPIKGPLYPPERRELTAIDGALGMIAVLLIVQMWLLTAALEAFLAGHRETALPAAIVSGVLFAGCVGLYLFVRGLDRRRRR
jgi:predicted Co/Zn/Cd cation transporter (cation efflux family)